MLSPSSPISPQVPMSPQIEMANSAGGMETALFSLLSSSDPFYDRTPWFKPIGRGQYPLFHLSKSVNKDMFDQLFTQKIRIINQNGQLKGKTFHFRWLKIKHYRDRDEFRTPLSTAIC